MKAQDSPEREKSEKGRQDSTPPAAPETRRLGITEELVQLFFDHSVSLKTPVSYLVVCESGPQELPSILGWLERAYNSWIDLLMINWITKVTLQLWHNFHMCGRYRLSRRKQLIEENFDAPGDDDWAPRCNVAPTQPVPIIRQHPKEPKRVISLVRWGLIPAWAKDASAAARLINARSETAHLLPTFKDALKFRRCLIPADGFYEWQRRGAGQPYCFEVKDGELFAFAGLWERWKDPDGNWIKSCSILTTTPNAVTSTVHDRMPVILEPGKYDLWLDPGMQDTETVKDLLIPYDAALMRSYPISAYVNNVATDEAQCATPVEPDVSAQSQLFE